MNIFVTGATGFVGRNFLTHLLALYPELRITCLVRDPAKAESQWPEKPKNLIWLAGDLLEPQTYEGALQSAERVFHMAALVSLKNGPEFYTMNTDTTRHLVQALSLSNRLRRLVYVGSISAVDRSPDQPADGLLSEDSPPHPNTDYGKSKLQAEALVRTSGLPYTILRPPYIYGPYARLKSSMDRLVYDVRDGRHYTRFPFPGLASEVYAEDLAEMIWLAGEHPKTLNEIFFVANPEPVRIGRVFADVADALGRPYAPLPVSPEKMERTRQFLYRRYPENPLLRILFENAFACSTEKWYRMTGYQPRYGYGEGVRRTVAWYRANGLL